MTVAGIILAAGSASRMKQPKLLLPWKGEPLIRHVANIALDCLDPVIVITGAWEKEVLDALTDLPVKIFHNHEWMNGQSTSIRAGIYALHHDVDAALFLLGDQPYVSPKLLQGMVEKYFQAHPSILAPYVGDKRSNPVLFDHSIFNELCQLEGDIGARAIFKHHQITPYTWHDEKLLLDIDTPEDYQKMTAES